MTGVRFLHLARHGEARPDESGLTERGRRQADLLGERLAQVELTVVHHGPLARAAQTARSVAARLPGVPLRCDEAAGDYLPHLPTRAELPAEYADGLLAFLGEVPADAARQGRELAAAAQRQFTGPVPDGPRHELVITHGFLLGWLVRAALDAPSWRWLGINHAHTGLSTIRYAPGRPPELLWFNDQSHLPADLRWTGFPAGHTG